MENQISDELYRILACPKCKLPVKYSKSKTELICRRCKKHYKIKEGIPVMID